MVPLALRIRLDPLHQVFAFQCLLPLPVLAQNGTKGGFGLRIFKVGFFKVAMPIRSVGCPEFSFQTHSRESDVESCFNVVVHSVSGRRLQVAVCESTDTKELKAEICRVWQVPVACQRLLLGIRVLCDADLLSPDLCSDDSGLNLMLLLLAPPCCASTPLVPSRVLFLSNMSEAKRRYGDDPALSVDASSCLSEESSGEGKELALVAEHCRSRNPSCRRCWACKQFNLCAVCNRMLICREPSFFKHWHCGVGWPCPKRVAVPTNGVAEAVFK